MRQSEELSSTLWALLCRLVSGTSLVAVLATAAAATKTYSAASVVDPAAAALVGAAAVVTAPLGAWLTTKLDAKVAVGICQVVQSCAHVVRGRRCVGPLILSVRSDP